MLFRCVRRIAGPACWLLLALPAIPVAASAQTMYRCGNVYQDHACDSGQTGKVVNATNAASTVSEGGGSAIDCTQRADAAQRIVWVRQTGQTEEMQLAKAATTGDDPALIRNVYRRGGTALQIRAAVEAECVAQGGSRAAAGNASAVADNGNNSSSGASAPSRRAQCGDLATTLDTLRQTQRIGGSATVVEGLSSQVREAQQRMRDAGC